MFLISTLLWSCQSPKEENFVFGNSDTGSLDSTDTSDVDTSTPEIDTSEVADDTYDSSAEPAIEDTTSPAPEVDIGVLADLHTIIAPGQENNSNDFGFRVANIQDADGDALSEVALSAPTYTSPEDNILGGAVLIYHGHQEQEDYGMEEAQAMIFSDSPSAYLGQSMSTCGANLYISAPGHKEDDDVLGAVYRFSMPLSGTISVEQASQTLLGPIHNSSFGSSIACSKTDGLMAISAAAFPRETMNNVGSAWVFDPDHTPGSIESYALSRFYGDREGQTTALHPAQQPSDPLSAPALQDLRD